MLPYAFHKQIDLVLRGWKKEEILTTADTYMTKCPLFKCI